MTRRGAGVVLFVALAVAAVWVSRPESPQPVNPCVATGLPSAIPGDPPADWIRFLAQPEFAGRHAGTAGAHQVGRALLSRLRRLGLTEPADGACQSFSLYDGLDFNIVADVAPTETDAVHLLVGAHYDGQGMHPTRGPLPGADDNASGVAVVLEVARRLAADPPRRVAVRIVLFSAEEVGRAGSTFYAARRMDPASAEPHIHAAMVLDMVGRPLPLDTGPVAGFAVRADDEQLWTRLRTIAAQFDLGLVPVTELGSKGPGASDDQPLRAAGIPVALLTSGLHEDYHEPGDLPERVDLDQVLQAAKLVEAWVRSYESR